MSEIFLKFRLLRRGEPYAQAIRAVVIGLERSAALEWVRNILEIHVQNLDYEFRERLASWKVQGTRSCWHLSPEWVSRARVTNRFGRDLCCYQHGRHVCTLTGAVSAQDL